MTKVLISTVPFAATNPAPIELLKNNGIEFIINAIGRKYTEKELAEVIEDIDVIIAGTEVISDFVLSRAKKLKLISRVGIGLDGIDLISARNRGIKVSYTPDAPTYAVAELTIGLMLSLLRSIHLANSKMHNGDWERFFGGRLGSSVIGLIGFGRIGREVAKLLKTFSPNKILINDLPKNMNLSDINFCYEYASKGDIYKFCDIISIHLPLNNQTKNMISRREFESMRSNALIINTSRGGIVNEVDLENALINKVIAGAAIDVFEHEPYNGPLIKLNNCLLTSHMGSMSYDCRERMELEATEEVIRFLSGDALKNLVPNGEYDARSIQ